MIGIINLCKEYSYSDRKLREKFVNELTSIGNVDNVINYKFEDYEDEILYDSIFKDLTPNYVKDDNILGLYDYMCKKFSRVFDCNTNTDELLFWRVVFSNIAFVSCDLLGNLKSCRLWKNYAAKALSFLVIAKITQ
jgi:hypothetical protein